MRNLDKQVVLVLCDEDEGNKDFLNGYKDISPDVKVISERILPELRRQYDLPECRHGDILIKNPFNQNYIRLVADTPNELRRTKLHNICQLAEKLGAMHTKVINATGLKKKRNLDIVANGNYNSLNGEIKISREDAERDCYTESLQSDTPGIETLTSEDYYEASKFAQLSGLYNDPEAKRLLDGRDPYNKNPLKSLRVEINAQSEINHLIDIAATCWAMDLFRAQCNYKETLEYRADYSITLEFEFP